MAARSRAARPFDTASLCFRTRRWLLALLACLAPGGAHAAELTAARSVQRSPGQRTFDERIAGERTTRRRLGPLDAWLLAHPEVAATMIWEFPPEVKVSPVARREIDGAMQEIAADPPEVDALPESPLTDTRQRSIAKSTYAAKTGKAFLPALPTDSTLHPHGARVRRWNEWPEWAREQLRRRYADYRDWAQNAFPLYDDYAASGFSTKPEGFDDLFSTMVDPDPFPVLDPPVNLQPDDPLVPGIPWTMLTSPAAFALYVRSVAAQLAVESLGALPWSLADYGPADLAVLFDGRNTFRYVTTGPTSWGEMAATGHLLVASVVPAPPLIVLGFLAQNGLIGHDRYDTLVRLLDWERHHLRHTFGGGTLDTPLPSGELFWGYNGRPPASLMINGTVMAAPMHYSGGFSYHDPEVRHWVGGCGGASGFSEHVLREVNIAAEQTAFAHFQNRFALGGGEYVALAHADNPYGLLAAPEIPTEEILLDDATFQAWFVNEPDADLRLKNVNRRVADLHLAYLPQILLFKHCKDTLIHNNDHANSEVYRWSFAGTYSVEELEQMGLWTGIEAKLATTGGCGALGF